MTEPSVGPTSSTQCPTCGKRYPGGFAFCPDDATALAAVSVERKARPRAAILSACAVILAALAGVAIHRSVAGKPVPIVSSASAVPAGLQAPVSSPSSLQPVEPTASTAPVPEELRRLGVADLEGKSRSDLDIMRNEQYARHGYRFRRPEIAAHFQAMPWYRPDTSDQTIVQSRMSAVERYNAAFILEFERSHRPLIATAQVRISHDKPRNGDAIPHAVPEVREALPA